ncbi:MAG: hypothetical protein WBM02_10825 [bacterium]
MINTIESILKLVNTGTDKTFRKGGIKTESQIIETAGELKKTVLNFGGSGWLLSTGNKLKEIKDGDTESGIWGFVIRGELFDGVRTLQINRTGRVWTVAVKSFDETADKLVEETSFRRHGYDENVCYQVEYDVVSMMNHNEIQPVNYRFCGWDGRIS